HQSAFLGNVSRKLDSLNAKPGEEVAHDATASADRDGNRLSYRWYFYREAGSYGGEIALENASAARAVLRMPADSAGKTIHIILEVKDNGEPPLTSYRRIVLRGDTVR